MAALQAQSVTLLGSVFNGGKTSSSLDFLTGTNNKTSGSSNRFLLPGSWIGHRAFPRVGAMCRCSTRNLPTG